MVIGGFYQLLTQPAITFYRLTIDVADRYDLPAVSPEGVMYCTGER
jgi:hypothetical protein